MKQQLTTKFAISAICSIVLLASPLGAVADDVVPSVVDPVPLNRVIITEIQTGNAARADEFIELYNTTDQPIDLTGWQLRYITASATSTKSVEDPSAIIVVTPPAAGDTATLLPANGHYLLRAGAVALPTGVVGQQYEGLLPATGGSLLLVSPDDQTCEFVVEDAVAWGNTTHLFGEGEAFAQGSSSSNDRLFQRYVDVLGSYVDTNNNAHDFVAANAAASAAVVSPGVLNGSLPGVPIPGSGMQSQPVAERTNNPGCTLPPPDDPGPPVDLPPPDPVDSPPSVTEPPEEAPEDEQDPTPTIPASNIGLKTPMLSELLPNPALPQTDKDDEFIELYNPNNKSFDLSGYILQTGLTTKRQYIMPAGTKLAPQTFLAFFSADTKLALSNSGSQVVFFDPLGGVLATSQAYGTAKDNYTWVLANGTWQWTTKPTPNAINVISAPAVKKSGSKKKTTITAGKAGVAGTSTGSTPEADVQQASAIAATSSTPLHPGALALIAVSALLYGAYEYRRDLANKIYRLRSNRAARAANRQSAKGR